MAAMWIVEAFSTVSEVAARRSSRLPGCEDKVDIRMVAGCPMKG
jgi:hypothetical protein